MCDLQAGFSFARKSLSIDIGYGKKAILCMNNRVRVFDNRKEHMLE